jgi:hypothetical protein
MPSLPPLLAVASLLLQILKRQGPEGPDCVVHKYLLFLTSGLLGVRARDPGFKRADVADETLVRGEEIITERCQFGRALLSLLRRQRII